MRGNIPRPSLQHYFPLAPSSSVALKMFIRVSSINNDSGTLTSRFKRCSTAPCTRRLTQSFYFYMFSDISKCHSTTTGKERLCHYRSLISSPLFRLLFRHIRDKRRVAPPAHHLSIFWLEKKRFQHIILNSPYKYGYSEQIIHAQPLRCKVAGIPLFSSLETLSQYQRISAKTIPDVLRWEPNYFLALDWERWGDARKYLGLQD